MSVSRIPMNRRILGDQEARRLPIGTLASRDGRPPRWTKVHDDEWADEKGNRARNEDVMGMYIIRRE